MMKSFLLKTLRLVVLVLLLLITTVIFNNPILAQETLPAKVVDSPSTEVVKDKSANTPACPEGTTVDTGVNPGPNCEELPKAAAPQPTADKSASPYDTKIIHKFDRDLYGD